MYSVTKEFIVAFAKLRKGTINFVMSARMEQYGSHWTDFHEIWYLSKICGYILGFIKIWQQ
jgi:hypothetical protein